MPMKREDHETLLNELLNGEIEHSRKTEILQQLREDHTTTHSEFTVLSSTSEKLQRDNNDLIVSNSKLFRQAGIVGTPQEPEQKKKELSETITIEAIERGEVN
jgi:hypothetical protein